MRLRAAPAGLLLSGCTQSFECRERFGAAVPEAEYFRGWNAGYDEWYRQMGSIGLD
jgi:hypothetical protein